MQLVTLLHLNHFVSPYSEDLLRYIFDVYQLDQGGHCPENQGNQVKVKENEKG